MVLRLKLSFSGLLGLVVFLLISGVAMWTIINAKTIRQWWAEAEGTEADLVVDLSQTKELEKPWANIAQGGESPDYQFGETVELMRPLELNYVRLDHVFDFGGLVGRADDGRLTYDWQWLDGLIGEITDAGALPFISLSYMPPTISNGEIVDPPRAWQEWSEVVRALIEHVSGRQGLNLTGVYYEVWNEPDLFGKWKTYGEKNYLTLYEYAARGAVMAQDLNEYKLGGPAVTGMYKNWVVNFLDYIDERSIRLDFFSWHHYEADLEKTGEQAAKFMEWSEGRQVELVISEWGHESELDPGFDTTLSAAHLIAGAASLPDEIDMVFPFEWQDGLDPGGQEYWGRWGMLTHESFGSRAKPRLTAMTWLQALDGRRVEITGQGSWVKAVGVVNKEGLTVVLTNYDSSGTHAELMPMTIRGLETGVKTITTTSLGGETVEQKVNLSGTTHLMTIPLQANEVVRVEIKD